MSSTSTTHSLEQKFDIVNPPINSQLPLFSDSMIHHNVSISQRKKIIVSYSTKSWKPYGVSKSQRILSPQLLLKKWDYVNDFLNHPLELTNAQGLVVFNLLRFWAYYGYVYPKESQVTEHPGCSKSTFWRTIAILRDCGLVEVVNRYVLRPHAQISNLYILNNLILLIAKYLAEHIAHIWPDWLDPIHFTPWTKIWDVLSGGQLKFPSLSACGCTQPG
jgi:hypothetical protein